MKLKNLTKSVSIIFMLLAMLFSCDQLTDEITNNSGNNTTQDGGNNNSGDNNSGNENGNENGGNNQGGENNGENSNTEKPAEKITITFDVNEIDEIAPETIETTASKNVELPTLTNAKFSHWNTKADGSGLSYKDSAIFVESVTLYAILRPENVYKITYELNGGINNPANLYYFTEKDAPIYLKNPTKDGYTFGGWYKTADFNDSKIVFLPTFNKEEGKLVFEDTTVYVKWYDETTTIEVTSSAVASKISELSDGVYIVKVTGVIDSAAIENIKTAMKNNQNALIDLDLSETTGLTSIDEEAFANCINLTGITIPFGVTDINYYAFAWCDSLTNVILPNSVTSIGDSSFWGCRNLISINIPKSVTEVSYYAFIYCNSLTNFDISTNHKNFSTADDGKSLYNKDKTELIAYPGASGNITILNGVTLIHGGIFNYNSDLTSVVIPDSVTEIYDNAFGSCINLTKVIIPDSVTTIGNGAFSSCYNLVTFDVNVNNGKYSASDDGKILYNKDKTELIGYPSASGDVEIPEGTISIEEDAFAGCPNLTSVIIPDSVTTIGNGAFEGCSNLTDITIGNDVISIGMMAFSYNPSLVNMIFKNTVGWYSKSIYNGASTTIDVSDAVSIAADFASGKYDEYYLYKE